MGFKPSNPVNNDPNIHQWFMFDYVEPDSSNQLIIEKTSLRHVMTLLTEIGTLQQIEGPPPDRRPLYRLKNDIPIYWRTSFIDGLGKKTSNHGGKRADRHVYPPMLISRIFKVHFWRTTTLVRKLPQAQSLAVQEQHHYLS